MDCQLCLPLHLSMASCTGNLRACMPGVAEDNEVADLVDACSRNLTITCDRHVAGLAARDLRKPR
jgi:hypothetical protein